MGVFRACVGGRGHADPARPQGWVGASGLAAQARTPMTGAFPDLCCSHQGVCVRVLTGPIFEMKMCVLSRKRRWPVLLVAFLTNGSGKSGPPPLWSPGLLGSVSQLLPSVLSAGLWEVPATEAVYSGVHPCLERAQRGDGGGEEVHSEVGLPATFPPACEPAFLPPGTVPTLLPGVGGCTGIQGCERVICEVSWTLLTMCGLRHLLAV